MVISSFYLIGAIQSSKTDPIIKHILAQTKLIKVSDSQISVLQSGDLVAELVEYLCTTKRKVYSEFLIDHKNREEDAKKLKKELKNRFTKTAVSIVSENDSIDCDSYLGVAVVHETFSGINLSNISNLFSEWEYEKL